MICFHRVFHVIHVIDIFFINNLCNGPLEHMDMTSIGQWMYIDECLSYMLIKTTFMIIIW